MDKWIDQMISTLEVTVATPVLMPLLIICMKPDPAAEEDVTPKVPETVPELYDMALRKTIRQNGGAEVVVMPIVHDAEHTNSTQQCYLHFCKARWKLLKAVFAWNQVSTTKSAVQNTTPQLCSHEP